MVMDLMLKYLLVFSHLYQFFLFLHLKTLEVGSKGERGISPFHISCSRKSIQSCSVRKTSSNPIMSSNSNNFSKSSLLFSKSVATSWFNFFIAFLFLAFF